jgi:hypothetical protein
LPCLTYDGTTMHCRLQVFDQIKTQEQTKQQDLKTKEAEFKAQSEKLAIVSWYQSQWLVAGGSHRSLQLGVRLPS